MRRLLVLALLPASVAACSPPGRVFDRLVIGTRRGDQDAVDPVATVEAGSRKDLAAAVDVGASAGWVYATWTAWPEQGAPRVIKTKMFATTGPKTVFAGLEGDTEGGWKVGTITCDFKTGSGQTAAGSIRVVGRP